ncbi:exosome complex component MTR3-like [Leptopilina heterotoma]|uniref:exosome complex component MTR3-like n=1 Tax=Leptopilina heterotoma TaxID=63436 RepID=UPI001CAA3965|nr:exosome complex component MTR3-like [Leptopilina heterotoma]
MPVDQKRINGPEISIPYSVYIDRSVKDKSQENSLKKREDGREFNELRKMFVKVGIVSQAKGSAYIEMGRTKVICSVFDPREIPNKSNYTHQGELFCEFKFATFSTSKRKIHQQDSEEKEYSCVMQRALEPAVCRSEFPNFQVDIYALVLENGGSALAAAIMAASLALSNANVPMFGLVTAVTMGIRDKIVFLDPTSEEETMFLSISRDEIKEEKNHGLIVQASMTQHSQITEFFFTGSLDLESMKSQTEKLNEAEEQIFPIMQQSLIKSVSKSLKKNEESSQEMET